MKKLRYLLTPFLFLFLNHGIFLSIIMPSIGYTRNSKVSLILLTISLLTLIIVGIAYLLLIGENKLLSIKKVSLKAIIHSFILAVIMPFGMIAISHFILKRNLDLGSPVYYNPKIQAFLPLFNLMFTITLCVYEETIYRAGLMGVFLRHRIGSQLSLVLSSIAFSLVHMLPLSQRFGWPTFWYYCICGIIYGMIFKKTTSIYPPIIVHIGFDIIIILLRGGYVPV